MNTQSTDELVKRLAETKGHTPGPWVISRDDREGMEWNLHIVSAPDPNLTICFMAHDGDGKNEHGEANAALIALAPEMKDTIERLQRELSDKNESGWLIERGDSDPAAPKYWAAGQREAERSSAWTSNHMEAIRLARREDAEKVAKRLFQSIAVRIAEHGWTTGPRCMKGRAQLSIACNCAVCQDLAPLDATDAARSEGEKL